MSVLVTFIYALMALKCVDTGLWKYLIDYTIHKAMAPKTATVDENPCNHVTLFLIYTSTLSSRKTLHNM
jgi:hypothetical protein